MVRESCVCTTPWQVTQSAVSRAREVAAWFRCPFVDRGNRSIAQVFQDEQVEAVVVADSQPMVYSRHNTDEPLYFHPGMAHQRLQTLRAASRDRLVEVADVQAGDTVIDATLGRGTDALVLAEAVGASGHVVALEASWILARLFSYTKHKSAGPYSELSPLLRRIEVHVGFHEALLASMPTESADVVYFDPMFRVPTTSPSSLDSARQFTQGDPLSPFAFEEAKRVARRCVVIKERAHSRQFARFGLTTDKKTGKVAYGVWWKGSLSGRSK